MPRKSRPSEHDNTGSDQITTLDAILIGTLVAELVLIFVGIFIIALAQHRATQRAAKIEKQFGLEQGPPKDKDNEDIVPKNQYWYAWLAAKARGWTVPNFGDIMIAMPVPLPLPPPVYGGKPAAPMFTTTQPTWPMNESLPVRGILATGDVDRNGSRVVATARCRPFDVSGHHAGFAPNSTGAEAAKFHRIAAHAFADPDAKPRARLEARFAESMVAPADTQEIDRALDKVNKVVAAKRPSRVVLRLFSALILILWIGGIAVFINTMVAKSNDQMWVTGALHWPGAQQQLLFGAIMFVGGWLLLIVATWYETRTPLATRVAVAKLNHPGAPFRYHFCMPPVAGRKSYVSFSPLRVGQAPIMAVSLLCFVAQVIENMSCSCNCDGDDEENGKESGPIWESWAAPLETEWIISVRTVGSASAPAAGHASEPGGYASSTGSVSSQSSSE
ncbi:hypothetical protein AMAG_08432 [Allomyces macrogynus ATCC 38327]|uniref:Uncharacterized protein n=1 Tax=Allomyces macrogynus (strain ATCC 38327) TaxID=578462 RepID=A0A0L0SL50_ALLM3|nr:hypothetical protein AMAG_08432 [Allomyces macrogynus ATCC 38327]|eukprot:KNE63291.1 hypothetical protein AMAG_08432 [Allomyces macrogynus ATCC 38327]